MKTVLFTLLIISSTAFANDTMLSFDEFNEVIAGAMSQHFVGARESLKSISFEKNVDENDDLYLVEGFDSSGNCYSKTALVHVSGTKGISVAFSKGPRSSCP